jgi:hypothetical protein
MPTRLITAALLLLPNLSSAAPAPAPAPTAQEIRDAIRNLDDEQYRVRTSAAKKLLAAGKDAIEPLVKTAGGGSTQVADRAVKIIQELAFNSTEETMAAARDALHRIAAANSSASEQARAALRQHRGQIMDKIQAAGGYFQFNGESIRAIYFDSAKEIDPLLPFLREFPEVEELSFSNKKFGDAQFKHLVGLKNLKWLNLYMSDIGDDSLKLLKNFPKLESIPMGSTRVTNDGLKHLADLKQLEYVGLRANEITDAGLVHLKNLTNLTGLTLQETKVTDAGLVHLKPLSKLNSIRLQKTAITDAGLEHLKGLKDLRRLEVSNTKVTREGAEKLEEAIPGLTVGMREDQ